MLQCFFLLHDVRDVFDIINELINNTVTPIIGRTPFVVE